MKNPQSINKIEFKLYQKENYEQNRVEIKGTQIHCLTNSIKKARVAVVILDACCMQEKS